MIRRLRMILPRASVLLGLLMIYLVFEGLALFIEWQVGVRFLRTNGRPGVIIPLFAALAYGVYRVVAFHPFYRPNYRAWLERSPWTSRKPLPLGPISLVWEDGVVLSLLAILSLVEPELDPIRLVTLFLAGYLALLGMAFALTGALGAAYLIAFGLGLMAWLSHLESRLALAVAIVLASLAQLGVRRSLNRFPWSLEWLEPILSFLKGDKHAFEASSPNGCGWPFDKLGLRGSKPSRLKLPRRDALLLGPLVGWWFFAIGAGFSDPQERVEFSGVVTAIGIWHLALFRLVNYVNGYMPPISFIGRLATFRWIIPGYDVVLLAPLCTLLFPAALYVMFATLWGAEADVSGPFCLALGIYVTFNMGPDLDRWELTGQHRIVPTKRSDLVKVG